MTYLYKGEQSSEQRLHYLRQFGLIVGRFYNHSHLKKDRIFLMNTNEGQKEELNTKIF